MFNLRDRLKKTRTGFTDPLKALFRRRGALSAEDQESLEELLLAADVGVEATEHFIEAIGKTGGTDPRAFLRAEFLELLGPEIEDPPPLKPRAIIVVGVNGVGKTTCVARLARLLLDDGQSVLLAAGDTFRAAAADQLGIWAARLEVDMIRHDEGRDPAAVAFDACSAARSRGVDVVIVDTAGRLHTRANLMEELAKIKRVCAKALSTEAVSTYLVLDATLGQNSLVQAEEFMRCLSADGIVLTKLDSTARGGIVIAIRRKLGIPVRYIGVGEQLDDFAEFSAEAFVDALLG